ncbi:MAG: hypothetical protein WC968_04660 [Bacilli bacterium]
MINQQDLHNSLVATRGQYDKTITKGPFPDVIPVGTYIFVQDETGEWFGRILTIIYMPAGELYYLIEKNERFSLLFKELML